MPPFSYTVRMTIKSELARLKTLRLADRAERVEGTDTLGNFERLLGSLLPGAEAQGFEWQAEGRYHTLDNGVRLPSLHLKAQAVVPMLCQRCLEPAMIQLDVDRVLLFAGDDAQARELDEASELDVLGPAQAEDVQRLVEDELILSLPIVPAHARCPRAIHWSAGHADFEAAQPPNPFAVLQKLKKKP